MASQKTFSKTLKATAAGGLLVSTMAMVVIPTVLTFKIDYLDLISYSTSSEKSVSSYAAGRETFWSCADVLPEPTSADGATLPSMSSAELTNMQKRYDYTSLIVDGSTHSLKDKSFNESCYQGVVNWVNTTNYSVDDPDIDISGPENKKPSSPTTPSDSGQAIKPSGDTTEKIVATYENFQNQTPGNDVVVGGGFIHANPITSKNPYNGSDYDKAIEHGYILLDSFISNRPDVSSVIFNADESSFYAGIATCMYLNDNKDEYYDDENLVAATYGGMNFTTVTMYMGGFEKGVKFFNEVIAPTDSNLIEVKMLDMGEESSYFTGTFNQGDGKSITQQMLNRGADAIFPVAGSQIIDTVNEIYNQGSSAIVIGVDTESELSDLNKKGSYEDVSGNSYIVKFSAIKNMGDMTSQILDLTAKGKYYINETDSIKGLGYTTVGNSKNGGSGLSENGWSYLSEAFNYILTNALPTETANAESGFETLVSYLVQDVTTITSSFSTTIPVEFYTTSTGVGKDTVPDEYKNSIIGWLYAASTFMY